MKEMDTWSSLGKLLTLMLVLVSNHFATCNSGLVFHVLIFLLCSLGLVFHQMNIYVPNKTSSSSSSLPLSSSSSSAYPSLSSFSKSSLYEVFISFRGEDTRKNFTGHLHEALTKAGINAFIDDELRRGEDITTELVRAIQGSRISIIVFSRRYSDSSWCLEELVKIMECRRMLGQLVLPIFYDVEPSHVRKQTGRFPQSFLKHTDEKKVERWRAALTEASNLSGWDLRNTLDGHEAKFIKMITNDVTTKLNNKYFDVAPYQVGIDTRVLDMSNYLGIGDSDDVRVIGISGMGGIGKTTIAKAIYNEFYERFEGKSFLEKVREKKLEKLQKQLLFYILQTKTKVSSVAAGTALVRERFRRLKVLVIVDDVDDVKQLRELVGNCHFFVSGSRIIITTRNESVLKEFPVDKIYRAKVMDREEALELLSWHAFRSSSCPSQYLALEREVVNYCGGLPLALEVLGSTLFKRSVDEWRSILDELKIIPCGEIQAQLKISYNGLNDNYKRRIFLDIACFFIGMDKNDVIQILDGCGFYATIGIKVLLDRCLVTINRENKIMMHDLLRDMGRDIVHAENPDFPRERSRLWHPKDVNDGTEKIEGPALNLPSPEETSFSTKAFRNMKRLRLLQLNYVRLIGGYKCLSKKLRWLCWHGFPMEFIPIELCQPNIVVIDMQYSSLRQVHCEYSGLLDKLKILNLSHSHDLTQSPDFSKFPNLEKLILKDCKRLAKVHKSIGDLKSLVLVNLKDCETLKALPRSFYKLKSVKTLVLDGCSRFQSLSEHLGEMASLVTLYANGTAIKKSTTFHRTTREARALIFDYLPYKKPCRDYRFTKKFGFPTHGRLLCIRKDARFFRHVDNGDSLSPKLIEFPGLDSALNSGLNLCMATHNNVIDFLLKDSTIQGWTEGGTISLVGRQIPTWFNHVNEGTQVSFEVPKEIGCNAKALAVCLASVPHDCISSCYINVINHTKGTIFCVDIVDVFPLEEILWLGNLSLSETQFNLEESDLIHVIAHCPVKKIGVRLVCDKLMTFKGSLFDYHYIPYERALEEISTEVDDFDEDYEDDDFDEDDANTMRILIGMMIRILMRMMRSMRRNKTMMRTKKLRMIMMRVMMRMRTKMTTTM
ncbi:unnamed protein product [Malus baccata var. baccata]